MNGKSHLILTTILFLGLWVFFRLYLNIQYFNITEIIAAIYISFVPDIDQNFKILGHRNWLTHSIIGWIIIYIFNPHFIFLLFILGVGFHCLCDTRFAKGKQVGFYTIKILRYKSVLSKNNDGYKSKYKLNGKWSTLYLEANFITALIIFLMVILLN